MPIASSDIDRADDPSGYPVATLADSNGRLMQVIVPVDATGEKALVSLIGAASGATDGGVAALAVRDDALSTLSDAEGDWVPLRLGDNGALWVRPDVAYGAGAVGATVPRTTLASDDPAVTALQVIDDWDESDRAKVNLIAGQAGVAGGSGVVGATTQRVVLASDERTVDTELPAAAALSDATANPTAPMVGAAQMLWDSENGQWVRRRVFTQVIVRDFTTIATGAWATLFTPSSGKRFRLLGWDLMTPAAEVTFGYGAGPTAFLTTFSPAPGSGYMGWRNPSALDGVGVMPGAINDALSIAHSHGDTAPIAGTFYVTEE